MSGRRSWTKVIERTVELFAKSRSCVDRLLGMFILFNTLVVRDRPMAAHAAFLEIDEYRMAIERAQATGLR